MIIQNRFYNESKELNRYLIAIMIGAILLLSSCTNMGPKTVTRDRFQYNTAISDSWKEQTLLNIVKLRYADMPLFVEISSVVSGYTLESSVNLGGSLMPQSPVNADTFTLGASGKYTDRPTITYSPITGQKFNLSFMTPIPPRVILFLMQSGYPADMIFPLTVDAVNGVRSRVAAGANAREGSPEFYRIIALLSKIQKSGSVGMRILKGKDQAESTVLFFYKDNITPDINAALVELNSLLGLDPEEKEMTVSYGFVPSHDREITMLTRSMLQIMIELATYIDVPPVHIAESRTVPSLVISEDVKKNFEQLIRINSTENKPDQAFAAVNYKNYWFWIDDQDFKSKRTFTFLMILISMTESGGNSNLPIVTIPAG